MPQSLPLSLILLGPWLPLATQVKYIWASTQYRPLYNDVKLVVHYYVQTLSMCLLTWTPLSLTTIIYYSHYTVEEIEVQRGGFSKVVH